MIKIQEIICLILSAFLRSYKEMSLMILYAEDFMFAAENMVFIYLSVFRIQARQAVFLWDVYNSPKLLELMV